MAQKKYNRSLAARLDIPEPYKVDIELSGSDEENNRGVKS